MESSDVVLPSPHEKGVVGQNKMSLLLKIFWIFCTKLNYLHFTSYKMTTKFIKKAKLGLSAVMG